MVGDRLVLPTLRAHLGAARDGAGAASFSCAKPVPGERVLRSIGPEKRSRKSGIGRLGSGPKAHHVSSVSGASDA